MISDPPQKLPMVNLNEEAYHLSTPPEKTAGYLYNKCKTRTKRNIKCD